MIILGAGLAGCLAGVISGDATILEAGSEISNHHQALLRFTTDNISKVSGIPFKQVKVIKGIWYQGYQVSLSPRMANLYSKKVSGGFTPRSILNLSPVDRYIAPDTFHKDLGQILAQRVLFNTKVRSISMKNIELESGELVNRANRPIISTMPMPILAGILEEALPETLWSDPIHVIKMVVPKADIYQSLYYPSPDTVVYRASMTGNKLIIESMYEPSKDEIFGVIESFGFSDIQMPTVYQGYQTFGKLKPMDESARKSFMYKVSREYNIWSLGRFACWRNIMLDDVYEDMYKIRKMIGQHEYNIRLEA